MKKNYIDKVYVEVNVTSMASVSEVKNSVDGLLQNKILPVIEEIIDEYLKKIPEDKVLQINKLSLDVDDLDVITDEFDLREKLTAGFYKALSEEKEDRGSIIREIGRSASETEENLPTNNQKTISKDKRWLQSLFVFLESGELPWWISDSKELKNLIESDKLNELIDTSVVYFQKELVRIIQNPLGRKRLVAQFPDKVNAQWIHLLINDENVKFSWKSSFENRLKQNKSLRTIFWESVWESLAEGKKSTEAIRRAMEILLLKLLTAGYKPSSEPVYLVELADFERLIYSQFKLSYTISKAVFTNNNVVNRYIQTLKEILPEITENTDTELLELEQMNNHLDRFIQKENDDILIDNNETKSRVSELDSEPDKEWLKKELQHVVSPEVKKRESQQINVEDGFFVEHAGLVLLHPFIKYYFDKLGLLIDKKQLKDKQLAAQLLCYLATGEWNGWEFSMSMEKYLTGISDEETLDRFIDSPVGLEEETTALFNAVRVNWNSMENASDALLRAEFIQRPGKLIVKDGMHKLIVEKKTQDILLNRLGWTVGMFKLPWMDQLLYVEW